MSLSPALANLASAASACVRAATASRADDELMDAQRRRLLVSA